MQVTKLINISGWSNELDSDGLWAFYCPDVKVKQRRELFVCHKSDGTSKYTRIEFRYEED